MAFLFLLLSSFVILIAAGATRFKFWESRRYMVDVEWLDDTDRFKLIARWGVK